MAFANREWSIYPVFGERLRVPHWISVLVACFHLSRLSGGAVTKLCNPRKGYTGNDRERQVMNGFDIKDNLHRTGTRNGKGLGQAGGAA
jgi:hypothetical protein